jgi:predicted metallo-beta-lactamase superfamily hydrolase
LENYHELLNDAGLHLVWFDSFGAKSSCIAIDADETFILIDPGAAAMQPSYPLPDSVKRELRRRAVEKIMEYGARSSVVIITHYHYDHHLRPYDSDLGGYGLYDGKTLYIKNPNEYINQSQWKRARIFLEELLSRFNAKLEEYLEKPPRRRYRDPLYDLKYIHERDYGEYMERRRELLEKGRRWFRKLVDLWRSSPWVRDNITVDDTRIYWAEGRRINIGSAKITIGRPCFHGIEYDRTGWVVPVYIENRGYRIFYSSDLMGPIIEDYAHMITDYDPDIVVLDGPPTYLFPYMFNRINLGRAIDNVKYIIDHGPRLIIYDHHLLRDINWRKRIRELIDYSRKRNVPLITASEAYGEKPLTDKIVERQL